MVRKIFITLCVLSVSAYSQLITGRTTTAVYGFQSLDSSRSAQTNIRAYENIYLNVAKDNISLNANALVSNDFGTSIATDPELRISSLMVKVRDIGGLADVSAGRQYIFAGAGYGLIDGVISSVRLFDRSVTVVGYGGTNVSHTRDIRKQWIGSNGMFGGQVIVAPLENGTVGVSYMNKRMQRKPYEATRIDSLFNPRVIVINSLPLTEELASVDLEYALHQVIVQAKSDYDFYSKDISRLQAFTRVLMTDELGVTAEYIFRQPRVAYNSIFSVFDVSSTKEIEGGIEYRPSVTSFLFARFGNVEYAGSESSQRIVVGGTYDFLSANFTKNLGYAGELNGLSLQAVCPMYDRLITPMIGAGFASYKLDKDSPSQTVVNATLGAVYRPVKMFSTDVQLQWMKNPLYNSDVRIFVKASYWFNERMGWF